MALKKRSVVSPAAGAVTLPTLMAELPGTRRLEELPLDRLSPAPTEWNFYAPLPDDKLLELIESIQTNAAPHRGLEAARWRADDFKRPQPCARLHRAAGKDR